MKLYQQVAKGENAIEDGQKIYSKIVYRTKKEAEDNMANFIERIKIPINKYDWAYLVEVEHTAILELELKD